MLMIKFLLLDCSLIALGMIAGAVLWSTLQQPKAVGYTVGVVYFDVWSYRNWVFKGGGGMGNCTHAIRCIEIGLFWWDLKLFWLAELPPVNSGKY